VRSADRDRHRDYVRDVITREFGRLLAIAEVAPNGLCVTRAHLLRAETQIKMALNQKATGYDAVKRALVLV
jgi:hypothetical protein